MNNKNGIIKDGIEGFYRVLNEPYTEDEYFRVYVDIKYDDGFYYPTDTVSLPVSKAETVYETTFFGNKRERVKSYESSESFTIYAVKRQDGLREIYTGRELAIHGESRNVNCIAIYKVGSDEIETIYRTLNRIKSRGMDYHSKLDELSANAYNLVDDYYKDLENKQKSREEAIQYLKSYRRY